MSGKKNTTLHHAVEFPKGLTWINTEPLTMKALRGKVVLVDFWTYSCVNCIRTFPYLRRWHRQYAKKGLVIIGVHTPEFAFEASAENVQMAVDDFAIHYPVVLDAEKQLWRAYQNHWWPRKLLIDGNGTIVFDHVGEGDYAETEAAIQKALRGIGAKRLPKILAPAEGAGSVCHPTTPELYLGYRRGSYANRTVEKGHVHTYRAPSVKQDVLALEGAWRVEADYAESHEGTLSVPYMAGSVNVVAEAERGPLQVTVLRDGIPLEHTEAGDDITFVGDKSVVFVREARMYQLVLSARHHEGILKLKVPSGVRLYALTFGGDCD